MSSLSLTDVWKIYDGDVVAVREASFEARDGEFLALLGPSGCGKSSTMRMIAGLETISKGEIRFGDKVVNNLKPAERNVALAFESYALYSPMTVRENLEFPLRSRGFAGSEINSRVEKVVQTFQISDLLDRKPSGLSGGQAQRVSIARALIRDPNVMLLDEPLSHLDYRLRTELRVKIRRIHDELGATTVYVTHDQEEAVALSDRIIVMNHAIIQQIGDVEALWTTPVNRFVAGFLGDPAMNFIDAQYTDGKMETAAGKISAVAPADAVTRTEFVFGFRPEDTEVQSAGEHEDGLHGEVMVNEFHGERCVLTIKTTSGQLKAIDGRASPWRPGDLVRLVPETGKSHLFCSKTGAALQHGKEAAA
ncbi:ABC transporter ATP-binding protein [Hoeflea prorocentri]|uniref:ABC transporter ATP-binding protein n=1 Tax=Hoeflea prorocentri TaxID=1922333 RepID=A0A9X3UFR4_9HYPH|nr:ABC transporter ATP-binding protein [Hoeflea prorocentri]MCY6379779.1 ABC transporter ATP-binding protein [Hoeflea prorocentri]MDA5397579.1 ABC transporter ATP-binding protein [Hoeflea prorocentri]